MAGSGQKTARALFHLHRDSAEEALRQGQMPCAPFRGALVELFATQEKGWKSVSGLIDEYDALAGETRIEIKSSMNGRKPRTRGKVFDEFCWLKIERRGEAIFATRMTLAPRGHPHTTNPLDGPRCIFDSNPGFSSNAWLSAAAGSAAAEG